MNRACLILQVLGTNDVLIDGEKEGLWQRIKGQSYEDIQQSWEDLQEGIADGDIEFDFPIIDSLLKQLSTREQKVITAIILSDQLDWVNDNYQGVDQNRVWELVAKDGIWAKELLEQWLKEREIDYYFLPFKIDSNFEYGVADWEASDNKIIPFLNQYLVQNDTQLFWQYAPETLQAIEKIVIQHSTGTPALKSSLYLWGIEKKLANYPIEFIYLTEEENCLYRETPIHYGDRWQWHLRLPLIRELLDIKDFSGALRLVQNVPDSNPIQDIKQQIEEKLNDLDRAVSFNLKDRGLEGRAGIIERIAIALWTEAAYRERQHWMHWYLRLVGAFELAILLLVEKQGGSKYQWQKQELIFNGDEICGKVGACPISDLVNQLLPKGEYEHQFRNKKKEYIKTLFTVEQIANDKQWKNFKTFYFGQWLDKSFGFGSLRNKLYHQLIGDVIDENFDRNDGVAEEVIGKLNYLLKLGEIFDEVNSRIQFYQNKYNKLFAQLLQLK